MTVERANLLFFDSNCKIGKSSTGSEFMVWSRSDLLLEMDRLGISRALVTHNVACEYDPQEGNAKLIEEIKGESRLVPCWVVLPHHTGIFSEPEQLIEKMQKHNVPAVRIMMTAHNLLLHEICLGELFSALQSVRVPVFLDYGDRHWGDERIDWTGLMWACSTFPDLPVILCRPGLNINFKLFPVMHRFSNLHIEISYFQVHEGLEELTRVCSHEQLLFGTGMPRFDAGAAMTMVSYSGLTEHEKSAVAGGNLTRLVEGVSFYGK